MKIVVCALLSSHLFGVFQTEVGSGFARFNTLNLEDDVVLQKQHSAIPIDLKLSYQLPVIRIEGAYFWARGALDSASLSFSQLAVQGRWSGLGAGIFAERMRTGSDQVAYVFYNAGFRLSGDLSLGETLKWRSYGDFALTARAHEETTPGELERRGNAQHYGFTSGIGWNTKLLGDVLVAGTWRRTSFKMTTVTAFGLDELAPEIENMSVESFALSFALGRRF